MTSCLFDAFTFMRIDLLLVGLCVSATLVCAEELKIESRPFMVEKTFNASVMPGGDETIVRIEPKVWGEFSIEEIVAHGKRVAKGEVLIRFDAEAIDRKLEDLRREIAADKISLDQAVQDLAQAQETAPQRIEALQRAAKIAAEENDHFLKVRRKAQIETADQQLERRKQVLANEQEELKQLQQMYDADDLTENTEEIILTRQKDAVAAAEFGLRMEQLDHQRKIEVSLPREEVTLANGLRDAEMRLRYGTTEIPLAVEAKKNALETLKIKHARLLESLAELEHDRTLFEIKAASDGWFYHGTIENGRWSRGESKPLAKYSKLLAKQAVATLISAKSDRVLTAHLDEATAGALPSEFVGIATPSGREDLEIPVSLANLSTIPANDGSFRIDLNAKWPEKFQAVVGTTMSVRVISHQREAAIVIPRKALERDARGWTVELKLADGKTERRVVKCGKRKADDVEVLSGLEAGQIILVP